MQYGGSLEGIGIPMLLEAVNHDLMFEWKTPDECERLTDEIGSSFTPVFVSTFSNSESLAWDDARISDQGAEDTLGALDEAEVRSDILRYWGSVSNVKWSRYPVRVGRYLRRILV